MTSFQLSNRNDCIKWQLANPGSDGKLNH